MTQCKTVNSDVVVVSFFFSLSSGEISTLFQSGRNKKKWGNRHTWSIIFKCAWNSWISCMIRFTRLLNCENQQWTCISHTRRRYVQFTNGYSTCIIVFLFNFVHFSYSLTVDSYCNCAVCAQWAYAFDFVCLCYSYQRRTANCTVATNHTGRENEWINEKWVEISILPYLFYSLNVIYRTFWELMFSLCDVFILYSISFVFPSVEMDDARAIARRQNKSLTTGTIETEPTHTHTNENKNGSI